jgi:hypothetical protein
LLHYINTDPAQTYLYQSHPMATILIDFPDPNEKDSLSIFLGFKDSMFKSKDFK